MKNEDIEALAVAMCAVLVGIITFAAALWVTM